MGGGIESNKISAIGLGNDFRKESPWWDNDGMFESQQNYSKQPFDQANAGSNNFHRQSDEFRM